MDDNHNKVNNWQIHTLDTLEFNATSQGLLVVVVVVIVNSLSVTMSIQFGVHHRYSGLLLENI